MFLIFLVSICFVADDCAVIISPFEPIEIIEEDDCNTSRNDLMDMFLNADPNDMELLAEMIMARNLGIDTEAELQHFLT